MQEDAAGLVGLVEVTGESEVPPEALVQTEEPPVARVAIGGALLLQYDLLLDFLIWIPYSNEIKCVALYCE